jgi:hypothetical protein
VGESNGNQMGAPTLGTFFLENHTLTSAPYTYYGILLSFSHLSTAPALTLCLQVSIDSLLLCAFVMQSQLVHCFAPDEQMVNERLACDLLDLAEQHSK